jgi:hypothetical protein
MKSAIAVLCIIAIIINAYTFAFTENTEWVKDDDGGNETIDQSLSVNVPDQRMRDLAPYDYSLYMQYFGMNTSSGAWYRYTLAVSGQWIKTVKAKTVIQDGFGDQRQTVDFVDDISTHFSITVEQNGSESVSTTGEVDALMENFKDLGDSTKVLKQIVNVSLKLTGIPALPDLPLGEEGLKYDASLVTFQDPNDEVSRSLDQEIFGGENVLKVNDGGQIDKTVGDEDWEYQVYNWTVEEAEIQSGYETLKVNITAGLAEGLWPFNRQIWISNDVAAPVREYTISNSTYTYEDYTDYILVKIDKTIHTDGFQRGEAEIGWGAGGAGNAYKTTHDLADFSSWKNDWVPKSGDLSSSSFQFGIREAMDFALDSSDGLNGWLAEHDHDGRVLIYDCWYNETKDTADELDPQRLAGMFKWNFRFAYTPTEEEMDAAIENWYENNVWEERWSYWVAACREVNRTGVQYTEDIYLTKDEAPDWNWSRGWRMEDELPSGMLTLSSSEDILRSLGELDELIEKDTLTGKMKFEQDDMYSLSIIELGTEDTITEMVNAITGMTYPESRRAYLFQQGTVWEDGSTLSASVDAETGRLVYWLVASGTPLAALLENL